MNRWTSSGSALLLAFLLTALNMAAQDPIPPSAPEDKPALTSPDSRSEWTLVVTTSGGFDGRGNGGFTLTSTGVLTCSLPRKCTGPIDVPSPVHGWVMAANLPPADRIPSNNPFVPFDLPPAPAGVCMDCVMTTFLLRIRDSKGVDWSYSLSWDPTTLSNIPSDFKKIFQAAAELAK